MSVQQSEFDAGAFVKSKIDEMAKRLGSERAIIAISGGVDSTTCAALAYKAVGKNLLCIFIDTGFMRLDEPRKVKALLSKRPLVLPIRIVRAQERFIEAIGENGDAEEKRKAFREAFYKTLSETAKEEGCHFLIQGTIAPDWIETKGGIKTQHNVLEQIGINPQERYGFKIIEPVANLYKDQVRAVARYLGIPHEICERQPFPGPGLLVRCVGRVEVSKLKTLKQSTQIVERHLSTTGGQQFFAVVLDNMVVGHPAKEPLQKQVSESLKIQGREVKVNILRNRATGVKGDVRVYGRIASVSISKKQREVYGWLIEKLRELQSKLTSSNPEFTRILYNIKEGKESAPYDVAIRAIETRDFMTADIAAIPWATLTAIAKEILKNCSNVAHVHYDLTSKPPATIEFE
jgi:GMP synthase (glutamine-hydrolysing)